MTTSSTGDVAQDIARRVKARASDRVLLTSSVADALALVCQVVPGGVVALDLAADLIDAPTDDDRRVVPAQIDLSTTLAAVESELSGRPAALLSVPAVAPATGEVLPLPLLAAIAHRHGARLLVDGSELIGRRAVNLTSHGIDYLVLAGHGLAALVGRADWLGGLDDRAHLAESEVAGLPVPGAIAEMGYEWAGAHEQALSQWLDAEIARLPDIRRLQLWPDARDRVGITSLAVAGHREPAVLRWDADTGIDALARQLNSLAENVFEQEKS